MTIGKTLFYIITYIMHTYSDKLLFFDKIISISLIQTFVVILFESKRFDSNN